MSDDGYRYCYTAEDGELVEKRKIADHEVLGMVHYPNANSMLVFSQKGEITMWTVWCVCLMFNSFKMIKVFKAFKMIKAFIIQETFSVFKKQITSKTGKDDAARPAA